MTKDEIIAELPSLSQEDLAEIRARLDELEGDTWQDQGELSEQDKQMLDAGLEEFLKSPNEGSPWEEVEARLRARLDPANE